MSSANARTARIAAQMQRALALLLQRGVKDPRVGNVTVTSVSVASDLSVAHVLVLPLGSSVGHGPSATLDATAMLEGLRSAAGFLRGQLARELRLRHTPRLEFALDRQLVHAHELTELIERTVAADAHASAPEESSDSGEHHQK